MVVERPKLCPHTLRWVADEMDAEAGRLRGTMRRALGTTLVGRLRNKARLLERYRKRLRTLATRQERRDGA